MKNMSVNYELLFSIMSNSIIYCRIISVLHNSDCQNL